MAHLLLLGKHEKNHPLAEITRIGRQPDLEIVLEDPRAMVSRVHARITRLANGTYELEDLQSHNGTRVQGVRIEPGQAIPLSHGDVLEIGSLRLKLVLEEASLDAPPILAALNTAALRDGRDQPAEFASLSPSDQRLELLYELGEALHNLSDMPTLLEALMKVVFRTLRPERGYIGIYDTGLEDWRYETALVERGARPGEFTRSTYVVREAMSGGKGLLLGDAMTRLASTSPSIRIERIRSAVCVPLVSGAERIGVLYVDDRENADAFTEEDLRYLVFLGMFAGRIIAEALRHDRELRASRAREAPMLSLLEGRSAIVQSLSKRVQQTAATSFPVLLLGETGTGKSTLAWEIHRLSSRRDGPFVQVNCAAITETLLESELFGYAPRSGISGADPRGKPGRFEMADGGTLFLDEIGDMPLTQQTKILTAVEQKLIYRLSSREVAPTRVDVRIIAATSRNLEEEVQARRFRQDLYFRLSRVTLTMPPLRERKDDIGMLAHQLLDRLAPEVSWRVSGISPAALDYLRRYSWPGNIRELENCMAHALLECPPDELIQPAHLKEEIVSHVLEGPGIQLRFTLDPASLNELDRAKREMLIQALLETGSQVKASIRLGYTRQWVIGLCKRFGIEVIHDRRKAPPEPEA